MNDPLANICKLLMTGDDLFVPLIINPFCDLLEHNVDEKVLSIS
jgi:hypothetical protein